MNRSLEIRRKMAEVRKKDRKLFLKGKLRQEQISLAAALGPKACQGPLIVERVRVPDEEQEDEPGT
jgi:hypothetical protein